MVKTVISPMPPVKISVILAKTEISQKKIKNQQVRILMSHTH